MILNILIERERLKWLKLWTTTKHTIILIVYNEYIYEHVIDNLKYIMRPKLNKKNDQTTSNTINTFKKNFMHM